MSLDAARILAAIERSQQNPGLGLSLRRHADRFVYTPIFHAIQMAGASSS